jgi:hypothetical protein
LPWHVGVRFAHACLQVMADDYDIDLLHIKGPAVDETLLSRRLVPDAESGAVIDQPMPRPSVDADILVRPSHVKRLFEAMSRHGWQMAYAFADGSAFEHASTWTHPSLEHVDVHRKFPGIGLDPARAFDKLWAQRSTTTIAGLPCAVPDVTAQRLILILHAVRGGALKSADIDNAWVKASDQQRAEVEQLAVSLQAQVALAAATGRLDEFPDARDYDLWKVLSSRDASLTRLWLARVKAQPNPAAAIRMGVKLIMPNRNRVAQQLGREPRASEMAREHMHHIGAVATEVGRLLGAAGRRITRIGR